MAIKLVIGTTKIVIHESIVNWLILCVLMSIFFIVAGKKIKKQIQGWLQKGLYFYVNALQNWEQELFLETWENVRERIFLSLEH